MGDDAQQREPIDALTAKEIRRVALLLLQDENEQTAGVDMLGARDRGVHHRLLNHAIEAERRLGFHGGRRGDGRKRLLERVMQLAQQRLQVDAARDHQNAARGWLVDNRQQQMLEPDIVTTLGGKPKCPLNRLERLGANGTGGLLMCSQVPSLVAGCLGLRLHCHQERELVLFGKILTVFNFVSATSCV